MWQNIKSNNNKYYVNIKSTNLLLRQIIRPPEIEDDMVQKKHGLWILMLASYY